MPAPVARVRAVALLAAGGVIGVAILAGCSSIQGESPSANPASSMPMSTPTPDASASDLAPAAPTSAAPSIPAVAPSDDVDPAYKVADAIMDQLNTIPPAGLTSELVVIAVSPQLRQVTEEYGVTSSIDVKGSGVGVIIESEKLRCSVTVSDPPETMLALACKKR